MSAWLAQGSKDILPYRLLKIGLVFAQREELHRRIVVRFHTMLEQGFLAEVVRLYQRGDLHPRHGHPPAGQAPVDLVAGPTGYPLVRGHREKTPGPGVENAGRCRHL